MCEAYLYATNGNVTLFLFANKIMFPRSTTIVCWEGDTMWDWCVIENVIILIHELPYAWASFAIVKTFIVFASFFSDISEQNNDNSDTLDFRRGWVREVGVDHIFRFGGPWLGIRNVNILMYEGPSINKRKNWMEGEQNEIQKSLWYFQISTSFVYQCDTLFCLYGS